MVKSGAVRITELDQVRTKSMIRGRVAVPLPTASRGHIDGVIMDDDERDQQQLDRGAEILNEPTNEAKYIFYNQVLKPHPVPISTNSILFTVLMFMINLGIYAGKWRNRESTLLLKRGYGKWKTRTKVLELASYHSGACYD
ncbi:hypothetical protein H6P81_015771 [Aristolochia fimbriata]|uniref:Uncharacterized protein n=1 Tax=Aristolochia fimbriata TaxID=158543 RepID=A0AAV7E9C7_ARIFI|nr:hypothetical protein H6P81_015771 [Aristolochia fimbriata]